MHSTETIFLKSPDDAKAAAGHILSGNILLLFLGDVYGFAFDPGINGLADKLNRLKGRAANQYLSLFCNHEKALLLVDKERVNRDFFTIAGLLSGKAHIRIPLKENPPFAFPYNEDDRTVQFISLDATHPMLSALFNELSAHGCPTISGTSGNLHGQPTCASLGEAEKLAGILNVKAKEYGYDDTKIVVADIPSFHCEIKGSFPIVSFLNPEAVEILRHIGNDPAATRRFLDKELKGVKMETSIKI